MKSLPLTTARQRTEWNTIKAIAQSNNFPDKVVTKLKSQIQQKTHLTQDKEVNKKNKKNGQSSHIKPKNKKTDKPLQTHRHWDRLQEYKHNTTTHGNRAKKPHT
jgi:hypothetical protein